LNLYLIYFLIVNLTKMDANKNNLLDQFKEYVLSYSVSLMGTNNVDNIFVTRMEAKIRAATTFAELPMHIHRIYASTARREKTVKAVEIQQQIYKDLNNLCAMYMMTETIPDAVKTMMNMFNSQLNKLDQNNDSDLDDSDYDPDYDPEEDEDEDESPSLMEILEHHRNGVIQNNTSEYNTNKNQASRNIQDQSKKSPNQPDNVAPQRIEHQHIQEEYNRIFGVRPQQPQNHFVDAAKKLDSASANELRSMLQAINRQQ
jgi:hypothetical protein